VATFVAKYTTMSGMPLTWSFVVERVTGAGDGNRTRTISLGSLWRYPSATCRLLTCGLLDALPASDRYYP
jgi:hypothetical protein